MLVAGLIAALAAAMSPARAESAFCKDLRAQIAQAGAGLGRYRAAAAKQQRELNRTIAYGRSIGCERRQFLIFGEAPPPQCDQLNAHVAQMRANLTALELRSADDGSKVELSAQYEEQCRERSRDAGAPPDYDGLFGSAPPRESGAPRDYSPSGPAREQNDEPSDGMSDETFKAELEGDGQGGDHRAGGGMAICVRDCDGGFFPVSYSARGANLDELDSLCKALCPNTEATLYTMKRWSDLNSAVSLKGDSYADHPNALKFQKTLVPSCGCKPPDKSWAEALAEAERILSASNTKDAMVTEEQAEQMSRPLPSGAPSGAKKQSTRRDARSQDGTTGAISAPTAARDQAEFRETIGPDGVKRRVRVVAPTL